MLIFIDTAQLPSDSDKAHRAAHHVPLSVGVASNVPGNEQAQCCVTDGDANKLVADMIDEDEDVLEKLAEAQMDWDEREHAADDDAPTTSRDHRPIHTKR